MWEEMGEEFREQVYWAWGEEKKRSVIYGVKVALFVFTKYSLLNVSYTSFSLKKTVGQSYTSVHFHLHEPPSFSCPSPASKAETRRWFHDYWMASSKRGDSGLSTSSPVPTSRWPRLSATRATSDRWTRETGPPSSSSSSSSSSAHLPRMGQERIHLNGTDRDTPTRSDHWRWTILFLFHTLALAIRRQEEGQWIKAPVRQLDTWGLSAACSVEERTEVGQSFCPRGNLACRPLDKSKTRGERRRFFSSARDKGFMRPNTALAHKASFGLLWVFWCRFIDSFFPVRFPQGRRFMSLYQRFSLTSRELMVK